MLASINNEQTMIVHMQGQYYTMVHMQGQYYMMVHMEQGQYYSCSVSIEKTNNLE